MSISHFRDLVFWLFFLPNKIVQETREVLIFFPRFCEEKLSIKLCGRVGVAKEREILMRYGVESGYCQDILPCRGYGNIDLVPS